MQRKFSVYRSFTSEEATCSSMFGRTRVCVPLRVAFGEAHLSNNQLNSAQRMRLGVEHCTIEIERRVGREEQIEILQRLREEVAGHQVALFLRHHAFQSGVAGVGPTILNEIVEECSPHRHI